LSIENLVNERWLLDRHENIFDRFLNYDRVCASRLDLTDDAKSAGARHRHRPSLVGVDDPGRGVIGMPLKRIDGLEHRRSAAAAPLLNDMGEFMREKS
jgi:hypothetical protein